MLSLEPPVFVVDVSNVSHHQTFVKKKSEKSLLFRFGLEFFDLVSPMVLCALVLDAVCSCKEPFDLDKGLYTSMCGCSLFAMVLIVCDLNYHTELSALCYQVLVLTFAYCGQGHQVSYFHFTASSGPLGVLKWCS
jgi:hypothetical protein